MSEVTVIGDKPPSAEPHGTGWGSEMISAFEPADFRTIAGPGSRGLPAAGFQL